jgi:ADP-heptose:LPS heptosyltransferase
MRTSSNDREGRRLGFLAARRFLFLQYETALGTAVHATPTYEALRKAVPDAVITVLSSGLPYDVLKYNPNIDSIIRTPHPLKEWGKAVRFFLTRLWKTRKAYDCVITDSGNRRSCFALLAFLTGVRRRIGFETSLNLNHASLAYDPDKSVLANNLSLIEALGYACEQVEPTVFCSPRETEEVDSLIREQGIAEGLPLVALQTQTSGGEPNQWYDDRFIEFADSFYESSKAQIIFVGTKSEQRRIEAIRGAMRAPSYSAVGRTDIPGLAALLSRCDLLVTLDTGTMHVGRAVNVPMVIIAPAKNPEHEWLPPHSENIRVLIRQDIACARCKKTFCATRECMDAIHPNEVLEAALQHLRKFPPSATARQSRLSRRLRCTSLQACLS